MSTRRKQSWQARNTNIAFGILVAAFAILLITQYDFSLTGWLVHDLGIQAASDTTVLMQDLYSYFDANPDGDWFGSNNIGGVAVAGNRAYFVGSSSGGASSKPHFGYYDVTTGISYDLTDKSLGRWMRTVSPGGGGGGSFTAYGVTYDSSRSRAYFSASSGLFGMYDETNNTVYQISTANTFLNNSKFTPVYDSVRNLIYIAGRPVEVGDSSCSGDTLYFGYYNASSGTFTNLNGTAVNNWIYRAESSDCIQSLAVSNGRVFIGLNAARVGEYIPATNTIINLTDYVPGIWTQLIAALAYDPTRNLLYMGANSGKFGYINLTSNTSTDLSAVDVLDWIGADATIRTLYYDTSRQALFMGTDSSTPKFGFYNLSDNTATNLSSKLPSAWTSGSSSYDIHTITKDTARNIIYLTGASNGGFIYYNISGAGVTTGTTTDLSTTDQGVWLSNSGGVGAVDGTTGDYYFIIAPSGGGGSTSNRTFYIGIFNQTTERISVWNNFTVVNTSSGSVRLAFQNQSGDRRVYYTAPKPNSSSSVEQVYYKRLSTGAVTSVSALAAWLNTGSYSTSGIVTYPSITVVSLYSSGGGGGSDKSLAVFNESANSIIRVNLTNISSGGGGGSGVALTAGPYPIIYMSGSDSFGWYNISNNKLTNISGRAPSWAKSSSTVMAYDGTNRRVYASASGGGGSKLQFGYYNISTDTFVNLNNTNEDNLNLSTGASGFAYIPSRDILYIIASRLGASGGILLEYNITRNTYRNATDRIPGDWLTVIGSTPSDMDYDPHNGNVFVSAGSTIGRIHTGNTVTDTCNSFNTQYTIFDGTARTLPQNIVYNADKSLTIKNYAETQTLAQITGRFGQGTVNICDVLPETNGSVTVLNSTRLDASDNIDQTNISLGVLNNFANGVYVCPGAEQLSDVTPNCANKTVFTYTNCMSGTAQSGVRCTVTDPGFRVSGLSGTGIAEIPNLNITLNETGLTSPIIIGGPITFKANLTYVTGGVATGATCNLNTSNYTSNGNSNVAMTYNSTSQVYEYTSTATKATNTSKNWTVSCTLDGQSSTGSKNPSISSVGCTGGTMTQIIPHSVTFNSNTTHSGNFICLAAGANNIVINCAGYSISHSGVNDKPALNITGRTNVTVQNCGFVGEDGASDPVILTSASDQVTLRNIRVGPLVSNVQSMRFTGTTNAIINNITINSTQGGGFGFQSTNALGTVSNVTFTFINTTLFSFTNASNGLIKNIRVLNGDTNGGLAVGFSHSQEQGIFSNLTVQDSSLNLAYAQGMAAGRGTPRFINTTLNYSRTQFMGISNIAFNVSWYLDVTTKNSTGAGLKTNITVKNGQGTTLYNAETASAGTIPRQTILQKTMNRTANVSYLPTQLTATRANYVTNNTNITLTASQAVTLTLQNAPDSTPPTWDQTPSNQTIELGTAFSYDLNATDSISAVTYAVNDTTNFAINSATGIITNATTLTVKVYYLKVNATDTSSNAVSKNMKVTVQDTTAPVWAQTPSNRSLAYGTALSYDINATDLQTITYWINDTTNFAINSTTGILTNNTLLTAKNYTVRINATDASNNKLTRVIKINVITGDTTPPTITATIPANNSVNRSVDTTVKINFSETMTASTFTTSSVLLKRGTTTLGRTISYNTGTKQLTITPYDRLAYNTTYTITLTTTITDASSNHNALANNYVLTFRTALRDTDNDGTPDYLDNDADNDGIADNQDTITGNAGSVYTTLTNISVTVNASTNLSRAHTGTLPVTIKNGTTTLVTFNYTFSNTTKLDLANISIKVSENSTRGSIVVRVPGLTTSQRKTVIVPIISNTSALCVYDQSTTSIYEISNTCTSTNELVLPCPGSISQYTCTKTSTAYTVRGLNHSGVTELNDTTVPRITSIGVSNSGTTTVTITLTAVTNELATCKFDTTNKAYVNLTNNMTSTNNLTHTGTKTYTTDTTGTYYIRCRDTQNNTMTTSNSTTFNADIQATSTGGSSGGGGGGGAAAAPTTSTGTATVTVTNATTGPITINQNTYIYNIDVNDGTATINIGEGVDKHNIVSINLTSAYENKLDNYNNTLIIKVLEGPPKGLPLPNIAVYKYLDIMMNSTNREICGTYCTNVTDVKLAFKIPKEWIERQHYLEPKVQMLYFAEGQWEPLPTTITQTTNDELYYLADGVRFSYFAISVREGANIQKIKELEDNRSASERAGLTVPSWLTQNTQQIITWAGIAAIIIVVLLFAKTVYQRRTGGGSGGRDTSTLERSIASLVKKSVREDSIMKQALEAGWHKSEIREALRKAKK